MKHKIKPLILYRIVLWASLALAIAFDSFVIVAFFSPALFGDKQIVLLILFLVLALVFSITHVFSGVAIGSEKRFVKQLEIENSYTLGEASQFYNLDAFKLRTDRLSHRRMYVRKRRYVMAFTPTALEITSNRGREKILTSLNSKLAKFLNKLIDRQTGNFDPRYIVYAFSRGIFFFCLFTNDDTMASKLMSDISNECFRMVNEDKVKIWVQPFFGIKVMEEDESIVSAIEDALIARDHSEKNYESFTYFKDSFRDNSNSGTERIFQALENNEIIPFYQPKYSLKEKRFVSCEALARWNHPEFGILGPNKFIDDAEKAGLLNAIDVRIFELAVKDLSEAIKKGRPVVPVSVNFSLYEFYSRTFLDTIVGTLKKYNVPPKLLEIEIVETTSQVNKFLSLSVIKRLKSLGVRVLMDDFGVGYSQIDNIRQIPFDAIKIDKSFTDRVLTDTTTASIVNYLVQLAHVNNMEAIIEGVETKEQVDLLRKLHIDTIQGFYYSRPLPVNEFSDLVRKDVERLEKKGAKK